MANNVHRPSREEAARAFASLLAAAQSSSAVEDNNTATQDDAHHHHHHHLHYHHHNPSHVPHSIAVDTRPMTPLDIVNALSRLSKNATTGSTSSDAVSRAKQRPSATSYRPQPTRSGRHPQPLAASELEALLELESYVQFPSDSESDDDDFEPDFNTLPGETSDTDSVEDDNENEIPEEEENDATSSATPVISDEEDDHSHHDHIGEASDDTGEDDGMDIHNTSVMTAHTPPPAVNGLILPSKRPLWKQNQLQQPHPKDSPSWQNFKLHPRPLMPKPPSPSSKIAIDSADFHNDGGKIDQKNPRKEALRLRNKANAAASRRRKKDYIETLEKRIKELEEENNALRRQNEFNKIDRNS